jgi:hypothetical protein
MKIFRKTPDCSCGHNADVHWASSDDGVVRCSAPGCHCSGELEMPVAKPDFANIAIFPSVRILDPTTGARRTNVSYPRSAKWRQAG